MSAYIVNRDHIDAMVTLALYGTRTGPITWFAGDPEAIEWPGTDRAHEYFAAVDAIRRTIRPGDLDRAHEVGRMLALENAASVLYRYPNHDNGDYVPAWTTYGTYEWSPLTPCPSPVEGLKLLDCYEYQSCEHPAWSDSEARRFCESLRRALIASLPGYGEAPWEWTHTGRTEAQR